MNNRQVRLKARPQGIPQAEHFEIVEAALPELAEGQVLIRNIYLSVDPAMRGWIVDTAGYSAPVAIGEVMRSFASGRVEASRHPDFVVGDLVTGMFGWQDYAAVDGESVQRRISEQDLPLSTSLGVLGLNGFTAYFGLLEIGQPKSGETLVVSTAAGAVGSCVGQIGNTLGCRTVGIAGGADKKRLCLEEFGFDAAIDYRSEEVDVALAKACPGGVDVYFDNTAGPISDAVLKHLRLGARVAICGTASIAGWDPIPQGPRVERHLLVKRARMQGFVVFDFVQRYDQARTKLAEWVRDGTIKYREEILDGIEYAPDAIAGLYRGENLGKRLIQLAPADN
ncbi:MAG: NADP-dependent oxidoreductase [Betaproteobacteria bacterium]|jgi:NADPH-dependent curcumin reductase CurA|nr:MAG: NADP-dependent oxidoreductase [Betaproteobacteria bacterium]